MSLLERITIEQTTERGVPEPLFVAHTRQFDHAAEVLRTYYLSLWPINVGLVRKLNGGKTPPGLPAEDVLVVECSLDDPQPDGAYSVVVPPKLGDTLAEANRAHRRLTIVLQEEKRGLFSRAAGRSEPVPGTYAPYVLDWGGIVGVAGQASTEWAAQGVRPDEGFMRAVQRHLAAGLATNLYTELGMLHRLNEEWDAAIRCYQDEIRFGLLPDGSPSPGSQRAFNNLGVVYKKQRDPVRARACFTAALALNPNYFEALVSIWGVIEEPEIALACVGRALRIRPNAAVFSDVVRTMAQVYEQPFEELARLIETIGSQVTPADPPPIHPAEPLPALVRHLLS